MAIEVAHRISRALHYLMVQFNHWVVSSMTVQLVSPEELRDPKSNIRVTKYERSLKGIIGNGGKDKLPVRRKEKRLVAWSRPFFFL